MSLCLSNTFIYNFIKACRLSISLCMFISFLSALVHTSPPTKLRIKQPPLNQQQKMIMHRILAEASPAFHCRMNELESVWILGNGMCVTAFVCVCVCVCVCECVWIRVAFDPRWRVTRLFHYCWFHTLY